MNCKWIVLLWILLLGGAIQEVDAQINEGGVPPSFYYSEQVSWEDNVPLEELYVPYTRAELLMDHTLQPTAGDPFPIGVVLPVELTMENAGNWSNLPGGERVWRLRIAAQDALAVMLYYKEFYIPEGGKLFLYTPDRQQVLGAYTARSCKSRSGRFATEFLAGEEAILEYVSSPTSDETPRISIEALGYGYNGIQVRYGWGSTSSCMVDINCEEGDAWQNEKRGVCKQIMRVGNFTLMCSGSLVNNTAQDRKPYILSAHHCREYRGVVADDDDLDQWLFYFHYERSGCNEEEEEFEKNPPRTMVGCNVIADIPMSSRHGGETYDGSDALLLLLDSDIPSDYNVYYNGWERSGDTPQWGVGIHHPDGDAKKISTYNSPAQTYTFSDSYYEGKTDAFWNAVFDKTPNGHGVTAGGSSGSPLFNERHLIVGSLTGGVSTCSNPYDTNIYGKFSAHWGTESSAATKRLDLYLDPLKFDSPLLLGLDGNAKSEHPLTLLYEEQLIPITPYGGQYNFVAPCGVTGVELTISAPDTATVTINGAATRLLSYHQGESNNRFEITIDENSYNLEVSILTSEVLIQRWTDVISVVNNPQNNGGVSFNYFRWFKDGALLEGESNPYLRVAPEDRGATFHAQLYTTTNQLVTTCDFQFDTPQALTLYPNRVRRGENVTVTLPFANSQGATLQLVNQAGVVLSEQPIASRVTQLTVPSKAGTYVVWVVSERGERSSAKLIVKGEF